jgi:hypothetical protein
MRTLICDEVPHIDGSVSVARDEHGLVRVHDAAINGRSGKKLPEEIKGRLYERDQGNKAGLTSVLQGISYPKYECESPRKQTSTIGCLGQNLEQSRFPNDPRKQWNVSS